MIQAHIWIEPIIEFARVFYYNWILWPKGKNLQSIFYIVEQNNKNIGDCKVYFGTRDH